MSAELDIGRLVKSLYSNVDVIERRIRKSGPGHYAVARFDAVSLLCGVARSELHDLPLRVASGEDSAMELTVVEGRLAGLAEAHEELNPARFPRSERNRLRAEGLVDEILESVRAGRRGVVAETSIVGTLDNERLRGCNSDGVEGSDGVVIQSEWWTQLGRFWERSTGGADVAAKPTGHGDGPQWPTVPRAAGVDEACAWLKDGFASDSVPRLLFLVGGPGAGKSHAASDVVDGLEPLDAENALAQRAYRYSAGDRKLIVINDATIGSDDFKVAPLSREIDEAVAAGSHVLACVNRGVLVEEIAQLRRADQVTEHSAGSLTVKWLHEGRDSLGAFENKTGWGIHESIDHSYVRSGVLCDSDSEVAELLIVFVDVNSLFEAAPHIVLEVGESTDIKAEEYKVARFSDRLEADSNFCPAGSLLDRVIVGLTAPDDLASHELVDPFLANFQSLQAESVRKGALSVLRASEIVSGQRMTFREIWGALSRCIIGSAHLQFRAGDIEAFVRDSQPADTDDASTRFSKYRKLAEFRFTQSIVGASTADEDVERDPVLRLTHLVDPVRDAIPGRLSGSDSGWSSGIADAFSSDSASDSPLSALLAGDDSAEAFRAAITRFDRELDAAYMAALGEKKSPLKDRERVEVTAWYGAYLTRLYAIASGIPAFRREVAAWTMAWTMAPGIPESLEDQLNTLLKPTRYPGSGSAVRLFPVFESRTNPIRGDVISPRIAIRSKDVQIRSMTDADSLFVRVAESGREEVTMLLDFPMVREAMACASGHSGTTELSDATSPRLERFRAARLVPGKHMDKDNYRIVSGAGDKPLAVETTK